LRSLALLTVPLQLRLPLLTLRLLRLPRCALLSLWLLRSALLLRLPLLLRIPLLIRLLWARLVLLPRGALIAGARWSARRWPLLPLWTFRALAATTPTAASTTTLFTALRSALATCLRTAVGRTVIRSVVGAVILRVAHRYPC